MVQLVSTFLFGDMTYDVIAKLSKLLVVNNNPILIAFFERSYHSLRSEIGTLPRRQRESFPRFSSIADLCTRQSVDGGLSPALLKALTIIYQLGYFISVYGESGKAYPSPTETFILGLCTGMLSAAAIASSKSLPELLEAAVHTVVIAFRTGLVVVDVRNRIEPGNDFVWSLVFPGVSASAAQEHIDRFVETNKLPNTSFPYISAHATNSLTISAPPSILTKLRGTPYFSRFKGIEISIHAPFHAFHLYGKSDIDFILEKTSAVDWATYTTSIPVISSTTGKLLWAGNFRSLLQVALEEILVQPVRWDKINTGIGSVLQSTGATQFRVIPIATNAEQTLYSALMNVQTSGEGSPRIESEHQEARQNENLPGRTDKSKIAIIGMSGRFPDAQDPEAFWDILYNGLDVHKTVPPQHWDARSHVDKSAKPAKNTSGTGFGCWLEEPGLFDARFFNMSPREAPQVDPAQRIALLTAYEAIEQAGIVPDATPSTQKDRVGIFYGVTSNDWMETNSAQDIDTYFIPGGNRAFIPGRINYFFKFSGPSFTIDTACSSSLAAIHVACNSLWLGDVDTAIAGGTNVLTNPDMTAGLDRGHFLSRTGNCKTFDDGADGYCRGEGVGTVILKRLEDAIADNDPIQALILGAYTNHSAEAESITRPHVGAQRAIFEKVLNTAGMDPYRISYVEMHGTGTQAGDAGEMSSVLETFAPQNAKVKRRDDQALYIGSAKSNIGHGEAVSGVTSLAKVLLMMKKNIIPPHCGIKTKINHKFPTDLAERNIRIAKTPIPWERTPEKPRVVFLNNFSAAGGNTAILLEDAPVQPQVPDTDPRSSHVVTISAKCAASMKGNLQSLITYFESIPDKDFSLSRLSYTTTARRVHYPHRVAVTGGDVKTIKGKLEEALTRGDGATRAKAAPKVTFAFTGQGAQYPGMGKQLYDNVSQFRDDINRFNKIAISQGFPSILPIFTAVGGDVADYTPIVVQLASTCLQIALTNLWASWGVTPTSVVGHSLGEFAALNVAGVITEAETIYLVGKRAQLLQEQCNRGTHAMLAVKASVGTIEGLLAGKNLRYEVACVNGPEDTVLSGTNDVIGEAQRILSAQKLKMTTLKVPYAFHSAQVTPILEDFEDAARGVNYRKPTIPIICPLHSSVVTESGTITSGYLARHCRESVNMVGALQAAKAAKIVADTTFVVEIGPHPVVSNMFKTILGPKITAIPTLLRGKDVWPTLTAALSTLYTAGTDIKWAEYHHDFKSAHKVLPLPAYSWDLKNYWMQYVHDWSLRKGDAPPVVPVEVPDLDTTTVHKVLECTSDANKAYILIETDISRKDINPLVQGHKVDNVPLCTPSVYCDIALTLGKYMLAKFRPELKDLIVDISSMSVEKALIAKKGGPQNIRCSFAVDWAKLEAAVEYSSVDTDGKLITKHSHCIAKFVDRTHAQELAQKVPQVKAHMARLIKDLDTGKTQRFNRSMAYRMVATLANFNPDFMGIDECILDSKTLECSAKVSFGSVTKGGIFTVHPAYIDALTQSGGFTMNARDDADLSVECFVNHGWDSFQLFEPIEDEKEYQSYVQMSGSTGNLWKGDIVLFDQEKLVGSIRGITLLGVPRRVLKYVLQTDAKQSGAIPPAPKKKLGGPSAPKKVAPSLAVKTAPKPVVAAPVPKPDAAPVPAPTAPVAPVAPTFVTKKVTKTRKVMKPAASINPRTAPAMDIIAEESGVSIEDLTDDCIFADMGVDSLLTLVIASRFREELELDFDMESMFTDFPTVRHLKDFLNGGEVGEGEIEVEEEYEEEILVEVAPPPVVAPKPAPAPVPVKVVAPTPAKQATVTPVVATPEPKPAPKVVVANAESAIVAPALEIIAEESGVALEDLTDDCVFADMGVDSLLTLVIASRFREELDLDFDMESMFTDFPTVKHLKDFLNGGGEEAEEELGESEPVSTKNLQPTAGESDSSASSASSSSEINRATTPLSDQSDIEDDKPARYIKPATSIILQGVPKKATKTLFLFPDGCGSATSYINIPKVSSDVCLIGLNSPYVRTPSEMTCTVDELIKSYLGEVRRRQPTGPYHLGGWSAGGILAFKAATELIHQGERILSLVLIDSPVPKGLDRLPQRFYDHCNSIGLFGQMVGGEMGKATALPEWLLPHFNATIDVLSNYHGAPLPHGKTPKVTVIWAGECAMDGVKFPKLPPGPDDTEGMKFLSEPRTDFGPAGWENYFPGEQVEAVTAEGAHHFGMMKGAPAGWLARVIDGHLNEGFERA